MERMVMEGRYLIDDAEQLRAVVPVAWGRNDRYWRPETWFRGKWKSASIRWIIGDEDDVSGFCFLNMDDTSPIRGGWVTADGDVATIQRIGNLRGTVHRGGDIRQLASSDAPDYPYIPATHLFVLVSQIARELTVYVEGE